ncbi:ABC transporter permease [Lichenifustis flavocetrariae]|uniref:ABC transporter permease n=1 Tax=Lichenifustis flavocetrariae TaxID=2949735 RepID=A0AA41Z063_9HYPH|nr:ABC transporter permease [Lichenifustis flavocetrariae]MCW6510526.1 ABC transporter permease [Lichenifustis flavocetrariae]
MRPFSLGRLIITAYMVLFIVYLLAPLVVMGGAAVNNSRFPSIYPWVGLTGRWFGELWSDQQMWRALLNTVLVAVAVVVLSVPIGTAAALLINSVQSRMRSTLYGLMVAPILTPGAVIGISTILFWNKLSVPAGLHLSVLGQSSFISAYAMLLVLARLQSLDASLEEAALDLGASHAQVMRRIVVPHLYPAFGAAAVIAFFQSVENFNVTLFTGGNSSTLTVYVFSQVRAGITPKINALALIMVLITVVGVILYEVKRRQSERRLKVEQEDTLEDDVIEGLGLPQLTSPA